MNLNLLNYIIKVSKVKNNEYVDKIRQMLHRRNVTLIYAAKDPEINHAIILKDFILSSDK